MFRLQISQSRKHLSCSTGALLPINARGPARARANPFDDELADGLVEDTVQYGIGGH